MPPPPVRVLADFGPGAPALQLREASQSTVVDVHIQDNDAALLAGWKPDVGRRLPPPPPLDRPPVRGGVPVAVTRQRSLGARLAGKHGHTAPGVRKGRLEQRGSR